MLLEQEGILGILESGSAGHFAASSSIYLYSYRNNIS